MAEDLAKFKLQFQQVEAALLGDPHNDELQKLKSDLTEMISLQVHLKKIKSNLMFRKNLWKQNEKKKRHKITFHNK